jgi:hypothetical protein
VTYYVTVVVLYCSLSRIVSRNDGRCVVTVLCAGCGLLATMDLPAGNAPTGLGKQREARTPARVAISGGPWRTRQDALVHLVLSHQQVAR